jgi:hypothetical protein
MANEELSRIIEGSLLRIELAPGLHTGISAFEAKVLDKHNRDGEFVVVMWLRPFFEEACELVFDHSINEWELFVRVNQALYGFPVAEVTVLEDGVTDKDDFRISL